VNNIGFLGFERHGVSVEEERGGKETTVGRNLKLVAIL